MPIDPDQSLDLTEEQLSAIAEVQAEIDLYLANYFADGRQIDIRASLLEPLYQYGDKVIDKLISNYELAGWRVVKYNSKRQGDWLSLSRS